MLTEEKNISINITYIMIDRIIKAVANRMEEKTNIIDEDVMPEGI